MRTITDADALDRFRDVDDARWVTVLIDDHTLCKVLVAWVAITPVSGFVATREQALARFNRTPLSQRWAELWFSVDVDVKAIAEATALDEAVISASVDVLRSHRLIYPDGTISALADTYIKATAMSTLRELQPRERQSVDTKTRKKTKRKTRKTKT